LQAINNFDFQAYINATLGNIAGNQAISQEQISAFIKNKSTIFAIIATPKSGSTFLCNALVHTLNLPYLPLCYAYSSNEHDLYLPALVTATINGCVSQLHMKGTPHNAQLLNLFKIKPVILTRNIFDSIESLARDLRFKCEMGNLGEGVYGYSFTWLTDDIAGLSDEKLIDFVIEFAAPWYVNQYVSWQSLARKGQITPLFVRYEDMMRNKETVLKHIVQAVAGSSVEFDPATLDANHMPGGIGNRGTGASGLGRERMTRSQVRAIKKLLSYYPGYDFESWVQPV